jgi:hypothetical protein
MTTTTHSATLENGLGALAFARRYTDGLLSDIPEDQFLFQPIPGANHTLWVMGHLALTDDLFLATLDGRSRTCPESWDGLFGMGSEPTGDAGVYPPVGEVRAKYEEMREQLLAWFGDMSDEDLARKLPDDWQVFAENQGVLMSNLAGHELIHDGQLTVIRKALGKKPAMA